MKSKVFLSYGIMVLVTILFLGAPQRAEAQYWQSLAGGTPGWAYATCVYNGQLIAGGEFGLLSWNGFNWSPVGGGVSGQVWALTVYNGELWAAGSFFMAGGVPVSYIAKWDGTAWSDPEGGTNGLVVSLTSWNSLLIAGGYFTTANIPANHIAAWNGHAWSALGSGTGGTQGQVMALSTYNGELIAGGFFTTAGGLPANHIAKWNGTSWSPLGNGIGGIVYALTNYGGNLIAGGLFSSAGGAPAQDIAQWNGSTWAPLGSGVGGGVYGYCLALASNGSELCAGGIFTSAGGASANCIALWNGSTWYSNMNGGMFNSGATTAVYALTPYLYGFAAGGIFTSAGGISSANVAQWVEIPAAQLHITLTPVSPPIVIPATGGSFNFNATVANQGASPATFDTWIMTQLPNLTWYGPALGPVSLTLPGGGSITRLRTQTVPATAPPGLYTYRGYVGQYSTVKFDSSSFTFTKQAAGNGPAVGEWSNYGEDFGAESMSPAAAPNEFSLHGAYPNPFNPTTTISFELPQASLVKLAAYDVSGQLVSELINGWREAGNQQVNFAAGNLPTGVYICHLQAGEISASQKLVLMK